jgi:hypothetical protein
MDEETLKTKMDQLKLQQEDPCIFYKVKNNKVVLILAIYVDATLCLGNKG